MPSLGDADALAAGERHLRRGVNRQVRADRANQPHQTQVLHEHGIDAGFGDLARRSLDRFEFAREKRAC